MYQHSTVLAAVAEQQITDRITAAQRAHQARVATAGRPHRRTRKGRGVLARRALHTRGCARQAPVPSA
jgi:hypothetical protein